MAKNTIIDGIAASEHLDSSGESLSIEGMDISSLGGPDSILNWEHGSKDRPSQVVGKVTFARKIMKKDDAKNKREAYFWNKIKKPFVYIKAELFDGLGHSGAQDVAAMLKYKNKDKGKNSRLVVGFSIEGGKIEKKGMQVTKSIARDVAITVKPCNKVCDAELIEGNFDDDFLYKNQNWDCEILSKGEILTKSISYRNLIVKDIKKNGDAVEAYQKKYNQIRREGGLKENKKRNSKKKEIEKLANKKINISTTENTWNSSEKNNMRKALIAGVMSGTPDSLTGGAALAAECLEGKIQNTSKPKKNKKKIDKNLINYTHKRMFKSELGLSTPKVKLNSEHGSAIAQAYDQMVHDPNHPEVQESYSALINETLQQYNDIMNSGLKISRIEPGMQNPYKNSKELHNDIINNNHLWYFPTEQGFGTENESGLDHPMLKPTGIMHGKNELLANDIFRIVHDINGHHKGGLSGFGPVGEHKAYLTHKKMYSPLASKALATETMGQNNWVNFGPYGEQNRKNPANTVYADQKAGLLPDEIINGDWHLENEIDNSIKKGQAPIQFTQLAGKSKPQSEVPILSNPMQAARFQKELGDDVPSSSEGMAMVTGQGKRRAISMEPSQTKKEMAQTKGRGNFPTTQYHEGFHDHINKIDQKYPKLKDHTQSLMRYALDNFFHPQDRGSMLKYLKDTQGYKENVNEEALAHFSDFRTSPSLRNNFNTFHDLGKKGNFERQTRIKNSMKKLNNWANTVSLDDMKKIHANYQKKDAITKLPIEKQKEMVKPERFKPGESGLNPKKIAASEK